MRAHRLLGRGVLILAMVALVALATTVAMANGRAGSKSVSASGSAWSPTSVTVTRGARVAWRNPTSVAHDVVSYGGKWSFTETILPGQSTSYVFQSAGTFLFRCTLHSYVSGGVCHGMCGRVVVQQ